MEACTVAQICLSFPASHHMEFCLFVVFLRFRWAGQKKKMVELLKSIKLKLAHHHWKNCGWPQKCCDHAVELIQVSRLSSHYRPDYDDTCRCVLMIWTTETYPGGPMCCIGEPSHSHIGACSKYFFSSSLFQCSSQGSCRRDIQSQFRIYVSTYRHFTFVIRWWQLDRHY